jgi:hypothetical protein
MARGPLRERACAAGTPRWIGAEWRDARSSNRKASRCAGGTQFGRHVPSSAATRDALATAVPEVDLTSAGAGVAAATMLDDNGVVNLTTVPMVLTKIEPTGCHVVGSPEANLGHTPQRVLNTTVLQPNSGNSCRININDYSCS